MFSAHIPNIIIFTKKKKNSPSYKRNNINKWFQLPLNNKVQNNFIINDQDIEDNLYDIFAKNPNQTVENTQIEFINEPFELKIIGYKDNIILVSLLDQKIYFQIGTDVVTNSIIEEGVNKNGKLFGKYIFTKFRNKITPIKINSTLHKVVVEFISNKNKEPISVAKMNVGDVYLNKSGNKAIFLGFIDTQTMNVKLPTNVDKHFIHNNFNKNDPFVDFIISYKKHELSLLWMQLPNKSLSFENAQLELDNSIKQNNFYNFFINKKHKFNNVLFDKKINVPNNIIFLIRNMTEVKINNSILNYRTYRSNYNNYKNINYPIDQLRHYDAIFVSSYSKLLNMVPYGADMIKTPILDQFKQWEK